MRPFGAQASGQSDCAGEPFRQVGKPPVWISGLYSVFRYPPTSRKLRHQSNGLPVNPSRWRAFGVRFEVPQNYRNSDCEKTINALLLGTTGAAEGTRLRVPLGPGRI